MRRIICFVIAAMLLSGCASAGIDISGMSSSMLKEINSQIEAAIPAAIEREITSMGLEELLSVQEQIKSVLSEPVDPQESITLQAGTYTVGIDIPCGYWDIRPAEDGHSYITWCDALTEDGRPDIYNRLIYVSQMLDLNPDPDSATMSVSAISLPMIVKGMYFICSYPVILTPHVD